MFLKFKWFIGFIVQLDKKEESKRLHLILVNKEHRKLLWHQLKVVISKESQKWRQIGKDQEVMDFVE